jgi:hypothetical protein
MRLAKQFLASQTDGATTAERPAWSYGYGRYDEDARRVEAFTPLPHWTGYAWQGGEKLPDNKLGWVLLTADGGHVGNDQNHAAVRRWHAPRGGMFTVRGELNHPSDQGDGVRGRIVSDRAGLLGEWTARHGQVSTRLERVSIAAGEVIDFVVDCRQSVEFDSFHWSPEIRLLTAASRGESETDAPQEWNAKAEFSGPAKPLEKRPLSPWEKYAQVLLLANETVFVD